MPVPTTPTVLEAFANTGGMPNASRAGYETSDDAPTRIAHESCADSGQQNQQ